MSALSRAIHVEAATYTTYNTSSGPVESKLNVHLVPHTHDDVGWLKTVDQYYVGSNNSLQNAAVHLILDSVIAALQEDPNRKFVYVEQAFFQRWWREQTPMKQTAVKKLVKAGQLEFINGGWCMHDEATTHYIDMIDQTTLGHRYIKEQFGKAPRIGWQIDPFGHSAVQGYLLGAELGFDALYFARIDYQEKMKRVNGSTLEMVWQASRTLDRSAQIFTGTLYDHYGPPPGFDFDMESTDAPIQDDPLLFDFNVKGRVDDFVLYAKTQAEHVQTNHIMWTMGNDFHYQNAHGWFKQMDKFINWVNKDGRVNVFYSTPSIYTDAKFAANESWPLKQDDFFPYADCPHCYWTGYFSSRPGLKGYVRILSNYFMMARQLETFVRRRPNGPNTDALEEAVAIAQHHDAVSGTEKQHTANDYARRLAAASSEAEKVVNFALGCLVENSTHSICQQATTIFSQCPLLNISYCPMSESFMKTNKSLVIVVYNALGWNRTDYIRLPVNNEHVQVTDSAGILIPSQLLPISNISKQLRNKYMQAYLGVSPELTPAYWLVFPVTVPALGFNTYLVSASNSQGQASLSTVEVLPKGTAVTVGPGSSQMTFDENGALSAFAETKSGTKVLVKEACSYYGGHTGLDGEGTDGAYIFRPAVQSPTLVNTHVNTSIITGPLVHEVWQEFTPWIFQVSRLYKDKDYAEVEFVVGPIPLEDNVGKDVILRFASNINSSGTFYTDSNGRDFIKRTKNYRADWNLEVNEPVAGNYYPLNLGMYIKDSEIELSLLVDRATGGSSIEDGQLEVMLHRRLLYDDGRGVGEPLNEMVCIETDCEGLTVQGKLFLNVSPLKKGSRWRRSMGQQVYSPLHLSFTTMDPGESWTSTRSPFFSGMSDVYSLPENVALITLQELKDGQILLRLAHLYELNEDEVLSTVAYVDLKKVFPNQKIQDIVEMNLSANQKKTEMTARRKWRVNGESEVQQEAQRGGPVGEELIVELGPMEIRTFVLRFE
ncbi:hypothetical protein GOP47_0027226 [Adiantum capillus-veneris]|nr:hypothetical protein GOP47_0027226 [Adiantum capillus-veneris]